MQYWLKYFQVTTRILFPEYVNDKNYPLLMLAVLKGESRCLWTSVWYHTVNYLHRGQMCLKKSRFWKPAVTFDCHVHTWLLLMQNICSRYLAKKFMCMFGTVAEFLNFHISSVKYKKFKQYNCSFITKFVT